MFWLIDGEGSQRCPIGMGVLLRHGPEKYCCSARGAFGPAAQNGGGTTRLATPDDRPSSSIIGGRTSLPPDARGKGHRGCPSLCKRGGRRKPQEQSLLLWQLRSRSMLTSLRSRAWRGLVTQAPAVYPRDCLFSAVVPLHAPPSASETHVIH